MSRGIAYANRENVLIPAITLQEIDSLKSEKDQLMVKNSKLAEDIKYLEQVMRDRGKGLAGPEKLNLQLKGQAEELRHVKRQKNDLKIVVDR